MFIGAEQNTNKNKREWEQMSCYYENAGFFFYVFDTKKKKKKVIRANSAIIDQVNGSIEKLFKKKRYILKYLHIYIYIYILNYPYIL